MDVKRSNDWSRDDGESKKRHEFTITPSLIYLNAHSLISRASLLTAMLLLAVLFPMAGLAKETPLADRIPLSGSDWHIHAEDGNADDRAAWATAKLDDSWVAARVPGNIQADLEMARKLTPHWYGAGDERIWEVPRKAWWYNKDIAVPASYAGRRLTLVFNGVDPGCEVFVNGVKVGEAGGMYRRLRFDITKAIRPGQTNRVSVRIPAMPEELGKYLYWSDRTSPLQPTRTDGSDYYPNGINRTRQVLKDLKSPTNFGWDWGVCIWTMGIWKDAALEASGPARIDSTRIQTTLSNDYTKAKVELGLEVNSTQATSVRTSVRLIGVNAPAAVEHVQQLKQGDNLISISVHVDTPALWWPNGQGEQPLYTAEVTLRDADSGDVLHTRHERFGIREIKWQQVEGAPVDFINPFQLMVNGRAVRMMGSNLIPPDLMFGRIMERGPLLLRRAQATGINTLRVWGGGVILPKEMYDLADELGIMLSQEFPLANAWPETDEAFLSNLEKTVTSIIKQTRNHPSIIEWSGGNEMPWEQGTDHAALHVLERLVAEHDDRIFRATCPMQGSRPHGPWTFDPGNRGTALEYNVGYAHYNGLTHMRHGEFGAPSPANLEAWYRTIPTRLHDVGEHLDDRIVRRKKVVYAVFAPNLWLNLPQIEYYFGPADGLPMTVSSGQFLGAEGLRYAMDSHRQRGAKMGGFMSWNFNEPWINGAGSYMIDYDGRPLMNYDFVRQALAPVALSLRHDGMRFTREKGIQAKLMLVSDAPESYTGLTWRWTVRDRRGAVVASKQGATDSTPQKVLELDVIEVVPPAKTALGPFFVELSLVDSQKKRIYERLHVFVCDETKGGLRGMMRQDLKDTDDDGPTPEKMETGPRNLAYVGNGAKPATATSSHALAQHQPAGLNDGIYGNQNAWLGAKDGESFTIELAALTEVGEVRLGRDRTGNFTDRAVGRLLIEVSADGQQWSTAAQVSDLASEPGFVRRPTLRILFPTTKAKFVRVTVHAANPNAGHEAVIDEFEVYAPNADAPQHELVKADFLGDALLYRPVVRTAVTITGSNYEASDGRERLTLALRNDGAMTALFCTAHPLLAYRTDLFIENNNLFIPPGETRTITVTADSRGEDSLTLAQLGWQVQTWNADTQTLAPSADVLLAVGRKDEMSMEFGGALNDTQRQALPAWTHAPGQPDAAKIAYQPTGADEPLELTFRAGAKPGQTAELRLSTADRSAQGPVKLRISVNGAVSSATLPVGYGLQAKQPEHLAQSATAIIPIPAGALKAGDNTVTIQVEGDAGTWLSWDAIHLVLKAQL